MVVGTSTLVLFSLLFAFFPAGALKDIVIERPKNLEVDFADLLLEYSTSVPPQVDTPVEISVNLNVLYANFHKNIVSLTVLFNQSWQDHRLSVAGPLSIPVPAKYANIIWKPATSFLNDVSDRALPLAKALHLGVNGEVVFEQKTTLRVPCKFDFQKAVQQNGWTNCSLDVEAFGWGDHVHYRLEGIQFSGESSKVVTAGEGVGVLRTANATAILTIPLWVNTGITKDVLQFIVDNNISN